MIYKINWRNTWNVFLLCMVLSASFLLLYHVRKAIRPDPAGPVEVSLTPDQVRAMQTLFTRVVDSSYYANQATRRAEIDSAFRADRYADSAHFSFLSKQSERDEKYNSALNASAAALVRELAERYDR